MQKLLNFKDYINVVLFGIIAMFGRAYEHGLTTDNIHYAAISKSLLSSDNPLLLTLGSEPYLNKPPLFFWLNSIAIWAFGSNVYGAKFVSILAAIAIMLLVFHLTKLAFDSVDAGYGAVLFFLVNFIVFKNSQACRLESLLTFFIMLSLIFTYKYISSRKRILLIAVGVFAGLAVLTKGFAGIFVFVFIALYLLITEQKRAALLIDLMFSAIAFLITFGWWYAYAFANSDLYQVFLLKESVARMSMTGEGNFQYVSIFKHSMTMLKYNFLLIIFMVIGFKRRIWSVRTKKYVKLFTWFTIIYFISIHFISSKYSRYLYVMIPFMSIAAGVGLASVLKYKMRKVFFGLMFIYAFFMVLYPFSTGQETFDEIKKVKAFAKTNSLNVCVDEQYYSHWERKSAMIFYYGEGYSVGSCADSDIKITSKNGECDGNILIKNRKVQACLK
ncbi:MAG: hypothetical protein C0602_10005 [Denitrovibrio sp.]|nr:MAG: hypothetical protein C0602_10005 [Denitrovibrio sp.]